MTNQEYRDAFKLTERERIQTWQAIAARRNRRPTATRWLTTTGGLAAAACVVVVAVLLVGEDGRGPGLERVDIAVHSSGVPAPEPPGKQPKTTIVDAAPIETGESGMLLDTPVTDTERGTVVAADDATSLQEITTDQITSAPTPVLSNEIASRVSIGDDKTFGVPSERTRKSVDSTAPTLPAPESGGTRNPNDRPYDLVYHQHYGVNPFVATDDDARSTFALEVDDASWSITRRYLEDGHLPPREAVRLEEIVNRLDAGYRHQGRDDFSLHVDGMPSRFGDGYELLRLGVLARDVDVFERRPAHLVFVIDVSGSMDRENRLGLVKRSLRVLVDQLQEGDRVGIVAYGSRADIVLRPTGVEDRGRILTAIDALKTGGSTNAEAGLRVGYEMARGMQREGTISRLILCSDGVANMGATGADSILDRVRDRADEGIPLTTVGFGMGNYNDVLMEQLADRGDGTYHYVHRLTDAEHVFRENLTGTLEAVGREVKAQVTFDPSTVLRWRLLGYENRDVADEDFRNDRVDAGELGAGHTAVALYEIKLTDAAERDRRHGRSFSLGSLHLRWAKPTHDPDHGRVSEIQRDILSQDISEHWSDAPSQLRVAAVAAEFAEILRHSYWARGNSLDQLREMIDGLGVDLDDDETAGALLQMIRQAAAVETER